MNFDKSRKLACQIYSRSTDIGDTYRELLRVSSEAINEFELLFFGKITNKTIDRALIRLRMHEIEYTLFCTMMPLIHWWEAECGPLYYELNSAVPSISGQSRSLDDEAMDFITREVSAVVGYGFDKLTIAEILQKDNHIQKYRIDKEKYSRAFYHH
ncbi:MAG: hypothetical protein AAF683_01025 [Pseudomonadota bacterium]